MEVSYSAILFFLFIVPICNARAPKTFYMPDDCTGGGSKIINVGHPYYNYNSTGLLKLKLKGIFYEANMNCFVKLIVPYGLGITVAIRWTDLRKGCVDSLNIRFDNGAFYSVCDTVRKGKEIRSYSSNSAVTIQFQSGPGFATLRDGFEVVFTSYQSGICSGSTFRCNNGNCISDALRCDGYNHCGDNSDQKHCGLSMGSKIGILMGLTFLAFAVASIIVYLTRKRRKTIVSTRMNPVSHNQTHYPPVATQCLPSTSASPPPGNIQVHPSFYQNNVGSR